MPHWLLHLLGVDNEQSYWYAFWSGFGGDLAIVGALLAGPVVYLRHHTCHEQRCWRLGHPHEGIVQCRKHRRSHD